MGACSAADGGAASPGPGRAGFPKISQILSQILFQILFQILSQILGRAPGADFLMGDRRTGGRDSTCGAVVAGSPSKRATRVRIPEGAIFRNFVEPTRGPVFCRGARFPNGFSIRKSIRKSDGTTMENPVLQFLMKSFGMEALT